MNVVVVKERRSKRVVKVIEADPEFKTVKEWLEYKHPTMQTIHSELLYEFETFVLRSKNAPCISQ